MIDEIYKLTDDLKKVMMWRVSEAYRLLNDKDYCGYFEMELISDIRKKLLEEDRYNCQQLMELSKLNFMLRGIIDYLETEFED